MAPALAYEPTGLASAFLGRPTVPSSSKPAPICPIQSGHSYPPTIFPVARPISAIHSDRVIPVVFTAFAHRKIEIAVERFELPKTFALSTTHDFILLPDKRRVTQPRVRFEMA